MLRIEVSQSVEAALKYYRESLSKGDYYMDGVEIPGQWHGKVANYLRLHGEVKAKDWERLIQNRRPDDTKLTQRDNPKRRPGYDLVFDVPKSVSVVHAISKDTRIETAFKAAVDQTMLDIEKDMFTRVRKDQAFKDRRTGNMIWADFTHYTSRPSPAKNSLPENTPDPHLHRHMYVINATYDPVEKIIKAGEFSRIKKDASYWQALYHSRLAAKLQMIGYEITPTKNAFELSGISKETIQRFSRRTQQIEDVADLLGIQNNPDAKAKLGRTTRRNKRTDLGMSELRKIWRKALPFSESRACRKTHEASHWRNGKDPTINKEASKEAIQHALDHELERFSEVSERRMLATALVKGIGQTDLASLEYAIAHNPEILKAEIEDETHITTREVLAEERELIRYVRNGRGRKVPLVVGDHEFKNELFKDPSKDTAEQKAAVEHVLKSQDWIVGVVGRAGTGKTTMLHEISETLTAQKTGLVLCAPTSEAARGVLRGEGFTGAETVKQLFESEKLQSKLKDSVLWVDEAGMLGNKDMLRLFELAEKNKAAKIVLAGDPTQIRSVPRGDAFLTLEEKAGLQVARLDKIQRQRDPRLKEAVEHISSGQIERGFRKLDSLDAVKEIEGEDRHKALAAMYVTKTQEKGFMGRKKTALVVSPTHDECESVSAHIREKRREVGELQGEDHDYVRAVNLGWTEAQRQNPINYTDGMIVEFNRGAGTFKRGEKVLVFKVSEKSIILQDMDGVFAKLPLEKAETFSVYGTKKIPLAVGDTLKFTKNATDKNGRRLNNGQMGVIAGFTESGDIEMKNGMVIDKRHGHFTQGYCITADSAQAKTVDAVYASIGEGSLGATDMRRFYVTLSRAREEARIFTDNRRGLLEAAKRDAPRMTAIDLLQTNTESSRLERARTRMQAIMREATLEKVRNWRTPRLPDRGLMPSMINHYKRKFMYGR